MFVGSLEIFLSIMPTASSASTAVLLATVLVFGLLPYYALGLSIDTVSWILVPQIVAAAMTQFILFHGYVSRITSIDLL